MKNLIQKELGGWMTMAHDHWKEYRPQMYRELKKAGKLEAQLEEAAKQTATDMDQMMDAGFNYHQAWEAVRQDYLILPEEEIEEEEEEPNLMQEAMEEILQFNQEMHEERERRMNDEPMYD